MLIFKNISYSSKAPRKRGFLFLHHSIFSAGVEDQVVVVVLALSEDDFVFFAVFASDEDVFWIAGIDFAYVMTIPVYELAGFQVQTTASA